MRNFLLDYCPFIMWGIAAFHLIFVILFLAGFSKNRKPVSLLCALLTACLFYDSLILALGSVLHEGSALAALSQIRFIFHGAAVPLLLPISAYSLGWKKKAMTVTWIITAIIIALGIAQGIASVLEVREIAGVTRYASSDLTPAWAETIHSALNYGTVLPLIISGIIVWVKQKTPALFLAGFLMFAFSALGPATGNFDLIFLISMLGEVCMVLFFFIYTKCGNRK